MLPRLCCVAARRGAKRSGVTVRRWFSDISVEQKYRTVTPQEHVLLRPDMYIGSSRKEVVIAWVADKSGMEQQSREIEIIPGFAKIFDEMLVNVADNYHRTVGKEWATTVMKVTIDCKTNTITIYNNGRCVDVEWHKDCEAYCPELVFGRFQAGSNFDDSEVRITGGRNGIGAKATNALSEEFTVEIGDARRRKLYRQTWRNSMKECSEPEITDYPKGEEYTKISFSPLLDYFGLDSLDEDHVALFSRRVADISACCSGLEVYLNDRLIPVGSFEEYVQLKYDSIVMPHFDLEEEDRLSNEFFFMTTCDKQNNLLWEIAVGTRVCNHLSFVNSIDTCNGGTHVDAIMHIVVNALDKHIIENYNYYITKSILKENISIFVNCLVGNPEFDGQTKERLTFPFTKWILNNIILDDEFLDKICQSESIVQPIIEIWEARLSLKNATAAKKRAKKISIPKLEDANMAGTAQSGECTLMLTEGDSAKSLAMAGISVVGRDHWGVFPLRGKIMNVSKANIRRTETNKLLAQVQTVLGLNKEYTYESSEELSTLRYGSVCLMCDQDADGSHIKGLLVNWLHTYWPILLEKGFMGPDSGTSSTYLKQIVTPLVKVFKKDQEHWFFSLQDYEKWEEETEDSEAWRVKYYKGLGTSTSKEGKEYFSELFSTSRPLLVNFKEFDEKDTKMLKLAFDDDRVQDRRRWLEKYEGRSLDTSEGEVAVADFVETDLASYFRHSNERAIPSCIDGLKPSHRKVLHTCFKRKLIGQKEMKVAQLGGAVAEMTAYHHGEASLHDCIIKLSQDYVGSGNNTPLLEGVGQFGTRLGGGADHASARYISTRLSPLARKLFREEDELLLDMKVDEGKELEPVFFIPILPVVLLNGALGIGTGHATNIPSHDPLAIACFVWKHIEFSCESATLLMKQADLDNARAALKKAEEAYEEKLIEKIRILAAENDTQDEISMKQIHQMARREIIDSNESNAKRAAEINATALKKDEMLPWYQGHKYPLCTGNISMGAHMDNNDGSIEVIELPIGEWTDNFKKFLDKMTDESLLHGYESRCTDVDVSFVLKVNAKYRHHVDAVLEKRLRKKIGSNMTAFTADGDIKCFFNATEIIFAEFMPIRREAYNQRKRLMLEELNLAKDKLETSINFAEAFVNKEVSISDDADYIVEYLIQKGVADAESRLKRTSIMNVSVKKLQEFYTSFRKISNQITEVEETSSGQFWREDILDFISTYVCVTEPDDLEERLNHCNAPPEIRRAAGFDV